MSSSKMARKVLFQITGLCAVLHLLVDGLCVCCLYLMASTHSIAELTGTFVTYNVLAFITQPLTGACVDRIKQKHWMLLTSNILLTLAVLSTSIVVSANPTASWMLPSAILLGIGNSLFHVWGGKLVAVVSRNDMRALGTFVSTGAFGLALGTVYFSWSLLNFFLLAICFLSITCISLDCKIKDSSEFPHKEVRQFATTFIVLALIALMAAVMIRSLVGKQFSIAIERNQFVLLLLGGLAMTGKMMGGWIARQMGIIKMVLIVITLTVACYLFKDYHMAVVLLGIFTVNCSMPVTLYLANEVLPGKEGLAFGLLAAALIPCYLLAII